MKPDWKGNPALSKWFIFFLLLWAIFVGEILPVWIQALEGTPSDAPGAKESMFSGLDMFVPTMIIYTILALFFFGSFEEMADTLVAMEYIGCRARNNVSFMRPQE